MTRRTWTAKRKLAVFEARGGRCHICGSVTVGGKAAKNALLARFRDFLSAAELEEVNG